MEKNDIPMIPKHQAESVLMHMSWAIRAIVAVSITFAITIIAVVVILVNNYTTRTNGWLTTYNNLANRIAATEVVDEKEETGDVQQLPIP